MKRLYPRGEEEFARVLAFSDGVYAIAITLLVLSIDLPDLANSDDAGQMLDALGDKHPQIISYAISFAVIGRYWLAHHQFFSRLRALDGGLIAINLVCLAVIAFLPFPTDVLGNYFENPVAVALYALNVARHQRARGGDVQPRAQPGPARPAAAPTNRLPLVARGRPGPGRSSS